MNYASALDTVESVDWRLLAPVLGPVVAVAAILVLNAIGPERPGFRRLHDVLAVLGLVGAGAGVLLLVADGTRHEHLSYPAGAWSCPAAPTSSPRSAP